MYFKNLLLKNFRNYSSQELNFNSHFNLLIGANAQGKTNIIEALYYLSYLHSFRTTHRHDLRYQGKDSFPESELAVESNSSSDSNSENEEAEWKEVDSATLIKTKVEREGLDYEIQLGFDGKGRSLKLNGKRPKIYQEYYGLLPVLLFEPREVYLFRDSPSKRRRYINRAVFLSHPILLSLIKDYEGVIQNKNRLLKEGRGPDLVEMLNLWNERLADLGSQIIHLRLQWIQSLNELLSDEYKQASGVSHDLRIDYKPSCSLSDLIQAEDIKARLLEELHRRQSDERMRRESLVGPHRDDWVMVLKDKSIGDFGSQGENRSGLIALKSAQIHHFQNQYGFPPVFLLDDVVSELDPRRSQALLEYLHETQGQVFLTTTDSEDIPAKFKAQGRSFLVEAGKVSVLG